MNKKKKLTIIFWYIIYKTNHKHTIYENKKNMKYYCLWTIYKYEHELDFNHNQNHIRNHNMKYEIFEIFDVNERYYNKIDFINKYNDLMKHLSWISISRLMIKIDERNQKNQY